MVTEGAARSAEGLGDDDPGRGPRLRGTLPPPRPTKAPRSALGVAVDDRIRDDVLLEILENHCKLRRRDPRPAREASAPPAAGAPWDGSASVSPSSRRMPTSRHAARATIVRFFPEPSRVRDEFLGELLETVARHGGDVRKIRKLQYSHMSKERREDGPYGQSGGEAAKEIARDLAQRSSAMDKAYVLVAYVKRAMAANGGPAVERGRRRPSPSQIFEISPRNSTPSTARNSSGACSWGQAGHPGEQAPRRSCVLEEIFFSRFDMDQARLPARAQGDRGLHLPPAP